MKNGYKKRVQQQKVMDEMLVYYIHGWSGKCSMTDLLMLQEQVDSDGELQLQEENLLVRFPHIFGLRRHDLLSLTLRSIKFDGTLTSHKSLNSTAI